MGMYENPPYYLTAYGLALKRGFHGSEQDWLDSLTAYGVAVKNGYEGTVDDWLLDLTAYGMAVRQGYEGTQEEWIESLNGAIFTPEISDGILTWKNNKGLENPDPINLYEVALGGIGRILSFIVPADDWVEDSDPANGFRYYYDLCSSRINSAMVPQVMLDESSLETASRAGMSTVAVSYAGFVRIKCVDRPEAAISLALVLSALNIPDGTTEAYELPVASAKVLGGIKSSDTLKIDPDGTAHVVVSAAEGEIADDQEVEDMLNDIFGEQADDE